MQTLENWKPIIGYEGRYEISDLGRVKSYYYRGFKRKIPRIINGCINPSTGYRQVELSDKNAKPKTWFIHRLILLAFVGKPPTTSHLVAHNDGIRTNSILSNLRWATGKENEADKKLHGTIIRGEKMYNSIFKEKDILKIRSLLSSNVTQTEIAKIYKVNKGTIQSIASGKTWKHVGINHAN